MTTNPKYTLLTLSILLFAFLLSGCTVIGLTVGGNIDRAARKKAIGTAERIIPLKPGRSITITLVDGREVTGVYQGLKQRPASEYIPLYERVHDSLSSIHNASLPPIGDTLTISIQTGKMPQGQLVGYGLHRLWLKPLKKNSPTHIPFRDITKITDSHGVTFSTKDQINMMVDDSMPSVMTILLRQDSSEICIPTDSISQVRV
ncbi:MAG: hypothetical protein V1897_01860, partial [Pseudomonadota bacterium]